MSVEPPPPDWVQSDAAFHHRRTILDDERVMPTRSSSRVVLESAPRAVLLDETEQPPGDGLHGPVEALQATTTSVGTEIMDAIRRRWEDLAFTTLRRTQLVAYLGFVVVLALTFYSWQRGIFSSMAAEISGGRVVADGPPAAPRLSSDQVAWTDDVDDDSRRSTASFDSDRVFAEQSDKDEQASGAKLFVASGKKSSKGDASGDTGGGSTRGAESGAGSTDTSQQGSTARKRTATTTAPVRYETCAQAAAAGVTPIRLGEPGYRLSLDADRDGVACETGSTPEDPGDGPVDSLYAIPTTTSTSNDSGSTTSVSSTGAGTTSTTESASTSTTSTTESPTTTGGTESSLTTTTGSTAASTSTTEATTSTASTTTTVSTTSSSSSTSTTVPTTIATTATTSVSTSASTTAPTSPTLPPIDPNRLR